MGDLVGGGGKREKGCDGRSERPPEDLPLLHGRWGEHRKFKLDAGRTTHRVSPHRDPGVFISWDVVCGSWPLVRYQYRTFDFNQLPGL